jgi:hypothetical protein
LRKTRVTIWLLQVPTRKNNNFRFILHKSASPIINAKHLVQLEYSGRRRLIALPTPLPFHSLADLGHSISVYAAYQSSAARLDAHKMDALLLAQNDGDLRHIFGKARHRDRGRRENIYFEAVFTRVWHPIRPPIVGRVQAEA